MPLESLKKKKIKCLLTREPGGTKSAELIRNLILKDYFNKDSKQKFDRYTDTLLYLAARNEHIQTKIRPALQKKYVVICDRFVDSTIAYQVYGKKVSYNFINNIDLLNDFFSRKVFLSGTIGFIIYKKNIKNFFFKNIKKYNFDTFLLIHVLENFKIRFLNH